MKAGPNQASKAQPATLLEILLEVDPMERVCYGGGYAFIVESLMSVLGNALGPIADKLGNQEELQQQVRDVQRIALAYRSVFRSQRQAMTAYAEAQMAPRNGATLN